MPKNARLDLVLFGATGFTGSITAKYIAEHGPKDLKWAIAARSQEKMNTIANQLRGEYPDFPPPETIVATLDEASAVKLASACKVIITTVGPYCRYGTGLVKACAEAGTHYVDCTGEHPWMLELVEKFHETAKKTGAIIVPECAFESAPADLTSQRIASRIREKYNAGTKELTFSLHTLNGGASGGTIETFLSILEVYGLSHVAKASQPMALSPISRPYSAPSRFPVWTHPVLGILTPWLQHTPDRAIVMRSWGLTQQYSPEKSWGDNFSFAEYKRVVSYLHGWALWSTICMLGISVLFPPFRWVARKIVTQPGFGPNQNIDKAKNKKLEWRAVGVADDGSEKKVFTSFRVEDGGDAYATTALMIAEAAFAILDLEKNGGDKDCLATKIGGGILTPASLGDSFVKRLDDVGVKMTTTDL